MEKLQYDLYYIKNRSMALNLYIIFETLKTVITRSGS
jgi:lipopolysaccharide/colanic/teichoic acid biosynthesis glycosyltransferase